MDGHHLDRGKSLSVLNHPPKRLAGPSLLHHLVPTSSEDALPALEYLQPDGSLVSLGYGELHVASDRLARRISRLVPDVETKQLVIPVLIPQSLDLYIALLAILKAGGAFCPLNLDIPSERAKFILNDVSADIVLSTSELVPRISFEDSPRALLVVDDGVVPPALENIDVIEHRKAQPSDLAYVMYTSGSTGTPKGVGISHAAATQSLLAHEPFIPEFFRFLQFAAPTFDVSVFEIFFPLFRGRTVVTCSRSQMLNDLPAALRALNCDACELTPTVAGSLLRRRENAPALKLLLTIGEMLTEPVINEFGGSDQRPSMLWAMYGPTEATIHCTLHPKMPTDTIHRDIGVPLDTTSVFVLKIPEEGDPKFVFEILPRGEVGELAVGGYQLAEGYLNRPEQTSDAFIDSSYGRLYRTGDKARIKQDGKLECLGRITDGQVKLRGQRLELGEVEQAALRATECHSAVAAVVSGILVVFCASDLDANETFVAVQKSCKAWLPRFMVPGDIVVLREFPRLPSGKINRKQLALDYPGANVSRGPSDITFKDDIAKQLSHLAQKVLGCEVDPSKVLSSIGMDSIAAIRFSSVLRNAGFNVTAIDVMDSRTISTLYARVTRYNPKGLQSELKLLEDSVVDVDFRTLAAESSALQSSLEKVETVIPCTPVQTSMLFETLSNPNAYCNWTELQFSGHYEAETIISWFQQLSQNNSILRTGFLHHDGAFVQVVFRQLDNAQFLVTSQGLKREFRIESDHQFLHPFNIQLSPSAGKDKTTVVIQAHHAIYDGWSMDLILADLEALTRGEQLVPRAQFRQLVAYYDSNLFISSCDTARQFWAGHFNGLESAPLPKFLPEISRATEVQTTTFDIELHPNDVREALQRLECSPQVLFQASLAWLWRHIVGNEDIVVGSVTSGRTLPINGIEDIVGPCIAILPLRTNISSGQSIQDLLRTIQATNRLAISHSMLPLADIKKMARVPAGQSLYDILFVYQESLLTKTKGVGQIVEVTHQDYLETKLLFEVEPAGNKFACRITHHTDTFPEAQVRLMANQLGALSLYMVGNFEADIRSMESAIPWDSVSVYNRHPETFSGMADLASAVESMAANSPTKTAICFATSISEGSPSPVTDSLSFEELNSLANKIGGHLKDRGAKRDETIAIVMEKSVLLYAAILAVLKLGCAYVPLLPNTPTTRLEAIFTDSAVSLCLCDCTSVSKYYQNSVAKCVDIQNLNLTQYPDKNQNRSADPSRLAYIIYTSGSTGIPKGVCLTQHNIMSNLDVLSQIYPVKEHSRLLQSCSQAFDVSVFEIFFAWTQGMCLCSATNDTIFEDLEKSIRMLDVTHLSMTPTVASLIDPKQLPGVEFLVTAGEAMTENVANKWAKQLYQGYGPSETTNICTVKKMSCNQVIQHLGWTFKNTSVFVLFQDSSNVVPMGCVGEFCFGGDQVARGYLNNPELTASKFTQHPEFGRIYRSGDLGRMLPDGSLMILGRVDDQVKLRGQRIELGEITACIRKSSAVKDGVSLLLRGASKSHDQLVSYFVPTGHETDLSVVCESLPIVGDIRVAHREIYGSLYSRLPSYMVPSYLIPISTLPVTASGKMDRAQLTDVFMELESTYLEMAGSSTVEYAESGEWTAVETQVCEILSRVFDTEVLHQWTPLVTVGLDSISAISVSKEMKKKFGKRLPVSTILQNSSVAKLSQALLEVIPEPAGTYETSTLVPETTARAVQKRCEAAGKTVEQILPCTPLQQGMLAASTDRSSYQNHTLLLLRQDPRTIQSAWNAMCARHAIFRTCFAATDDIQVPMVQVVLKTNSPAFKHYETTSEALEDGIAAHIATVPSAIDSWDPPVSFALISCDRRHYLSLVCHHALYDGVAVERMLLEVELLMTGAELSQEPSYEVFLQESSALPTSTDDFWRNRLFKYEPQLLPRLRDTPIPAGTSVLQSAIPIQLQALNDKLRLSGVSLLSLCESSWAICLGILMKSQDVCFGTVLSGRSLAIDRIDELVAPCFNTIPIRVKLSDFARNMDLVNSISSLNPLVLEHQFTPLKRIHSLVDWSDSNNRRLFDTLLILQQPSRPLDEAIWVLERDDGAMDFPLVCEIIPDPKLDRLVVKLHSEHYFPKEVLSTIFNLLSNVIDRVLNAPASPILAPSNLHPAIERELASIAFEESLLSNGRVSPTSVAMEDWSETEATIRSVFSQLSSSPEHQIYRGTTIYQLGLDSINAVQVASMLRKQGLEITASDVVEAATCEGLATLLAGKNTTSSPESEDHSLSSFREQVYPHFGPLGVNDDELENVLPCTPLQIAMLAQFLVSGGQDYLNFVTLRLLPHIDIPMLVEAWQKLCAVLPILRVGFVSTDLEDCSFAMIQYPASARKVPVTSIPNPGLEAFDIGRWRSTISSRILQNLHQPPWCVVCVEHDKGITMHVAIHHALYDATSLQVIFRELAVAISGDSLPNPSSIEACVVDIRKQNSDGNAQAEAFWKAQVGQAVINRFPVMTPVKETQRQILVESILSDASFSSLEQASRLSKYPLQVIFQAAWTRVLSSYLGELSVTFGTVLSGRNSSATQKAVFPCITTVPVVAVNLASNKELLTQMLKFHAGAYRHQHTTLARLQQWSTPPYNRLFDTLLVFQKLGVDRSRMPWQIIDDQANIDYAVSIEIEPVDADKLEYRATFYSDVLPAKQARLLLEQLSAMACELAANPEKDEKETPTLPLHLLSFVRPKTPELPSSVQFAHEFVEIQARQNPYKTALYFVDELLKGQVIGRTWTYRDLNDHGNRVARLLVSHVTVGDIVAVHFDKFPEAFFSILGILKAGCGFVALDPASPVSRKEFILEDAKATAILTSRDGPDFLLDIPKIIIHEEVLKTEPSHPVVLDRSLSPSDTCYCLYTSGTTGVPKGCEITHENVVQCMLAFQDIFAGHWDSDSKWLQFASFHFDVSVLEQYWSWSVGITLVSASRDLILEDLAGTISSLEITHIDLTPSLARLLHPDEVPSLCRGVFITGGESLTQEILDVWGPKAVVYNFYGPTEATIGVTVYPRVPSAGRPSNIGWPFINVGVYVLKPGTEDLVPKGGVGELCVSGKLVGQGYLDREDLTAERFPTLQRFGERVYRTGDLVRMLHNGCLDFLGRADDQVKLRGQRLEIGEINHAIKTGVSEVTDVATLVIRNEEQAKSFLVSFVVSYVDTNAPKTLRVMEGPESAVIGHRVKEACRLKLPEYMVPTYVLGLPFIPLSSNNKAEVKQLRALFNTMSQEKLVSASSQPSSRRAYLGASAQKIANAIASMTSIDAASITPMSSIFELGIDSISVLRFARVLKKEGLRGATPSIILKHPQIADLANMVDIAEEPNNDNSFSVNKQLIQAYRHRYASKICKELNLSLQDLEYIVPCSPLQQGMISRSFLDGAYFNVFNFKLAKEISESRLKFAWKRLVDECEILRTVFLMTDDGHLQVALKAIELPWSSLEDPIEQSLEETLSTRHDDWIMRNRVNVTQPLELLFLKGDAETGAHSQLIVHIFHGLYDASSFEIMTDLINEYYSSQGGKSETTSSDYSAVPRFLDALQEGPLRNFGSCKPFWEDHLENAPHERLPSSPSAAIVRTVTRSSYVAFEPMDSLIVTLGVTHQAIVQAAWVSVLANHYRIDPTIGIVVAGRSIDLDGVENTIGPMFNTLPFYARLGAAGGSNETWASLLQRCHDFNVNTLPFQHVPLRDIQKWCFDGKPLFDTIFSFQRETTSAIPTSLLWTQIESEPIADYPLALEATLSAENQLRLLLVAHEDVANSGRLQELLDAFREAMASMVARPDSPAMEQQESLLGGPAIRQAGYPRVNGNSNHHQFSDFEWTDHALMIQKEIATLAAVAPEDVTETASLLELGLDSIDAIKLSSRLNRSGIRLTTSELMKWQKISELARLAEEKASVTATETLPSLMSWLSSQLQDDLIQNGHDPSHFEAILPTTPLQDSMIAEMVHSDFQLYFNHDVLEISAGVDVDRLLEAWRTVVYVSPILRTVFLPVENPAIDMAYCQCVQKNGPVSIQKVVLDNENGLSTIINTAIQRARKGAGRSSLLQLTLASLGTRKILVLSVAHALYDGWSLDMLHRDVQSAYNGQDCSRDSYEPFLDRTVHSATQEANDFWSRYLENSGQTSFPITEEQPESTHYSGHRQTEAQSGIPLSTIKGFCRRYALSLQVLGQACWAALLATKVRSLDVTFGVVLLGRDTEAEEGLMFPTMNTVALRSILHGNISNWLRYMQENMSDIANFQHFPLRKALGLTGHSSGQLFNTLFILQKRLHSFENSSGQRLMTSIEGSAAVEYPVCLEMETSEEYLLWRVASDSRYLSADDASLLLQQLDAVLTYIIESPLADLLVSSGQGVSICGLPNFQLVANQATSVGTNEETKGATDWSPTEQIVRQAMSEVSEVPESSILKSHNIYNLGLDSISSLKVSSLLRKLGLSISPRDMRHACSISKLAEMATQINNAETIANGVQDNETREVSARVEQLVSAYMSNTLINELEPSLIQEVLPATPMQVHVLAVWQNTGGRVFYPEFRYQLTSNLDRDHVLAAWRTLTDEAPILRTVFLSTGSLDMPVLQVILRRNQDNQLSTVPKSSKLAPLVSLDVEAGGTDKWLLKLRIHHALYDGVSLPILMETFSQLLSGTDIHDRLDNFLLWKRLTQAPFNGAAKDSRRRFWVDYLHGVTPVMLPRSTSQSSTTSRVSFLRRGALEVSALLRICANHGISVQSAFFAAYAQVLASYLAKKGSASSETVVFGVYLANRNADDTGSLPYPTLRLVPLKVAVSGVNDLFTSALAIQEDLHAISSPANVDVGLWEIKDWTGQVFDSFVNFLSLPSRASQDQGAVSIRPEGSAEFSVDMSLEPETKGSHLRLVPGDNPARDAYPDMLDIEVSVHGDSMDIGVFGSPQLLSVEAAEGLVMKLTQRLAAVR